MIACVEELRGGLAGLPGRTLALALTAGDGQDAGHLTAAKAALGLEVRAEHDGEPACDWCGRSDPPGGLADESLGGPQVHACVDGDDCARARAAAEPLWYDNQHRGWRISWEKYREVLAYEAEQARHSQWGGGIYRLTADLPEPEPDQLFLAALAEVRDMVEGKAARYLELAAATVPAPAPAPAKTGISRRCREPGCTHTTMRCPDNRRHTLGYFREHPQVHDAASAAARRDMLARARSG